MFYRKNIPGWERALRVIVGFCTIAFGLLGMSASLLAYLIVATGLTALLTGFVGFCPMCAMVGRRLDSEPGKEKP
ncbi:hypothetical protein GCM10011613_18490 [Cellvibrio zantedeschiae]|uniref:Inner membrane protein YgaP-like transmembrane domain-containing protein n=1 Tax=Cellvibrio zantedeschiae TaxID=1237077 RepID=A0ABQ3B514_9GAMM|nr:DUF2892 domain-containing protein [Cellvibrio zantedeschiae]GGY73604.1 hypothetical protein GCM10011613_18490 [Cellvibrio zantedeschiae]